MAIFRRKSSSTPAPTPAPAASAADQAVIVHYALSDEHHGTVEERKAVFALETRLESLIDSQQLGELDGNEFGGGEVTLYCYGPDAARLFAGIESEVRAHPARPAFVILRFGDVSDQNATTRRIDL